LITNVDVQASAEEISGLLRDLDLGASKPRFELARLLGLVAESLKDLSNAAGGLLFLYELKQFARVVSAGLVGRETVQQDHAERPNAGILKGFLLQQSFRGQVEAVVVGGKGVQRDLITVRLFILLQIDEARVQTRH